MKYTAFVFILTDVMFKCQLKKKIWTHVLKNIFIHTFNKYNAKPRLQGIMGCRNKVEIVVWVNNGVY